MSNKVTTRPTPFCDLILKLPTLNLVDRINKEDVLDMNIVEVEHDTSLDRFSKFDDYIRYGVSEKIFPREIMKISNDAFKVLYDESYQLLHSTNGGFITALKIIMGFDSATNKLSMLFQPLCTNLNDSGNYEIVESESIYYYHSADKIFKKPADTLLIGNYQAEIRVRHNGEATFNKYIKDIDTDAVIFPFQTIFTLMHDNLIDGDNAITLINSLATDDSNNHLRKHSIVLFATRINKRFDILHNKFANRSHLCPPGCGEISNYSVLSPGPTTCP